MHGVGVKRVALYIYSYRLVIHSWSWVLFTLALDTGRRLDSIHSRLEIVMSCFFSR